MKTKGYLPPHLRIQEKNKRTTKKKFDILLPNMTTPTPTPGLIQSLISSPIWTPLEALIAMFVGVGGIGFTLFRYWTGRQIKELSYSILSDFSLANIDEGLSVGTNIKVMVGERQVKNVRYVALRIRNSGNMPITISDFTEPLWFLEGKAFRDKNLISANIYETQPPGITMTISINDNNDKVSISSALLNSGDAIFIAMLLSDYQEPITVNGRIVGIKQIKQETFVPKQPFSLTQILGQLSAYLIVILLFAALLSLPLWIFLQVSYLNTFIILALTLGLVVLGVFLFGKTKQLFHR